MVLLQRSATSLAMSLPKEQTLLYHQSTTLDEVSVFPLIEHHLSVRLPHPQRNEGNTFAVVKDHSGSAIIAEPMPTTKDVELFTQDRFVREQLKHKNVTIFRPSILSTGKEEESILQSLLLESQWCGLTSNTKGGTLRCEESVHHRHERVGSLNMFSVSGAILHVQLVEPYAIIRELEHHLRNLNPELADGMTGVMTYWSMQSDVGKLLTHMPMNTREMEMLVQASSGGTIDTIVALRARSKDLEEGERMLDSQNDMIIRNIELDRNHLQRDIIAIPARVQHIDGWKVSLRTQGLSFARKGDVMLIATSNRLLSQSILRTGAKRTVSSVGTVTMNEDSVRGWVQHVLPFLSKDLERWIQVLSHQTIILRSLDPLTVSWGGA